MGYSTNLNKILWLRSGWKLWEVSGQDSGCILEFWVCDTCTKHITFFRVLWVPETTTFSGLKNPAVFKGCLLIKFWLKMLSGFFFKECIHVVLLFLKKLLEDNKKLHLPAPSHKSLLPNGNFLSLSYYFWNFLHTFCSGRWGFSYIPPLLIFLKSTQYVISQFFVESIVNAYLTDCVNLIDSKAKLYIISTFSFLNNFIPFPVLWS